MILLQQAGLLPHPEKPSSLPMSVATRARASSPLSPPKSLGLGPSFHQTQEEELAKVVEQDPMLEELCKPLCCKLCNVTLNSAQQAQAHYQVRRPAGDKAFRAAASAMCVDVPVPVSVLLVTLLWEHRAKCGLMHRECLSCSREFWVLCCGGCTPAAAFELAHLKLPLLHLRDWKLWLQLLSSYIFTLLEFACHPDILWCFHLRCHHRTVFWKLCPQGQRSSTKIAWMKRQMLIISGLSKSYARWLTFHV